ncbi:MAG: Na+/H+ antiporter subunit E [Desulfatiglans sp.]|jgi:multicomponent Na+:H+ antiporter subunit E|nr:Na+/H+ antiporter subunit E [Desulfatiglans sp.]
MKLIKKPFQLIGLALFFLKKLVEANLFIAKDLLTPGLLIHPDYINVRLMLSRDYQILLLANLISMTPGSLAVDVTPDRKEILVHSMYASDKLKVIQEIDEFQIKIKRLFQ